MTTYDAIDPHTGEVVYRVIDMQGGLEWGDCSMCEQYRHLNHAVAFYEEPQHCEIGEQVPGYPEGCIAGGMCVCKSCHDGFYGI